MQSFNGTRPFLGTNPIAFAAPVTGSPHFCLDMSTTRTSWNKVQDYGRVGRQLEVGWAADARGGGAELPESARQLLPIADYKGYGLALMIEILCGVTTGNPHITKMYADNIREPRELGHCFILLDTRKLDPEG